MTNSWSRFDDRHSGRSRGDRSSLWSAPKPRRGSDPCATEASPAAATCTCVGPTTVLYDKGRFDAKSWAIAFVSDDAEDIYHVFGVTGAYQALVNHLVEMLQTGARLAGLDVVRGDQKPSAPRLIDAVKADKGLTANQAEVLKRLYRTRNDLQHASLDAQADEVYNDIVLLQKTLARFARSYMRWLDGHGAQLLPRRKVAPSAGAAEQ